MYSLESLRPQCSLFLVGRYHEESQSRLLAARCLLPLLPPPPAAVAAAAALQLRNGVFWWLRGRLQRFLVGRYQAGLRLPCPLACVVVWRSLGGGAGGGGRGSNGRCYQLIARKWTMTPRIWTITARKWTMTPLVATPCRSSRSTNSKTRTSDCRAQLAAQRQWRPPTKGDLQLTSSGMTSNEPQVCWHIYLPILIYILILTLRLILIYNTNTNTNNTNTNRILILKVWLILITCGDN